VDEQLQIALEADDEQLAAPAHTLDQRPLEHRHRWVVGPQRIDSGREHALHPRTGERLADPASGDLDLRQLRHRCPRA